MPCLLLINQFEGRSTDDRYRSRPGDIIGVENVALDLNRGMTPGRGVVYIEVTDREVSQALQYREEWRRSPAVSVVNQQYPNLRLRVESVGISPNGRGRFRRPEVEDFLYRVRKYSPAYHDRGMSGQTTWFEFDITVPGDTERDAVRRDILRAVRREPVSKSRFAVSQAAVDAIVADGGYVQRTAAQVASAMRDKMVVD